ncbi:hypothetical protein N9D38_05005 [Rubripirellula sp.]|nr:hypothetical protein [Rubripirellula sp.]
MQEPIRWLDEIDSSRVHLPKVVHPVQGGMGCFGILLGIMFAVWPCAITAFFYWGVPARNQQPRTFDWIDLAPLAFFGVFLFPASAFILYRSVLTLFGRTEILITQKHLSLIRRLGLLRHRRRCRLDRLEGFRVEYPGEELPSGGLSPTASLSFLANASSLVAKHSGGRRLYLARAFPNELIRELVQTLPQRVQRVAQRSATGSRFSGQQNGAFAALSGAPLPVENIDSLFGKNVSSSLGEKGFVEKGSRIDPLPDSVNPIDVGHSIDSGGTAAGERATTGDAFTPSEHKTGRSVGALNESLPNAPLGSSLVLQTTADGLTIELPKRGYYGSTTPIGRVFFYCFTFMQMLLSGTLVPALLAGKVQGSLLAGWVIFGVFTSFWILGVIYLIYCISLHGMITLDDRYLRISQSSFKGAVAAEWQRREIDLIELGIKEYTSDDGPTWDYYVKVSPEPLGDPLWFSYLSKPELQWIVESLRIPMSR